MPVHYKYSPHEHHIYVECLGELTIEEITAYFDLLAQDDSIPKGTAELVDLSRITYFNINHRDAGSMPANYTEARFNKEICATIVFGYSPINKGLVRLIEAYFRKHMPEHVFRTVDSYHEALEILKMLRSQEGDSIREA